MDSQPEPSATRRVIKRYSNRKLYDTEGSRYVTLLEIAEMVRAGEEVQVIDNQTKEDKTDATLALIIAEELKERPRGIPISTLKALIRHRGERLLSTLREGPIGRLIPRDDPPEEPAEPSEPEAVRPATLPSPSQKWEEAAAEPPAPVASPSLGALRRTLEQWQAAVDERLRSVLPASADLEELKLEVRALNDRLARLEDRLDAGKKSEE